MLTKLSVDNFKTFVNFDLSLERVNSLIGANGAGKTTVLDVLSRLQGLVVLDEPLSRVFTGESLTRWQTLRTQSFRLTVAGNGGEFTYELAISYDEQGHPTIKSERLEKDSATLYSYRGIEARLYDNQGKETTRFPYPAVRSFISQIDTRSPMKDLLWFRDNFLRQLWFGRLHPPKMGALASDEVARLAPDGANFAACLRKALIEGHVWGDE